MKSAHLPFAAPVLMALSLLLVTLPGLAAEGGGSGVSIEEAYVRATPPTVDTTAAYLTVRNQGTRAVILTGASCEQYEKVEIHGTSMADGVMKMRRLTSVEIPPRSSLSFGPGSLHLMLIGGTTPMAADATLNITLNFADGAAITVSVPVKDLRDSGDAHGHHMNHGGDAPAPHSAPDPHSQPHQHSH